MSVTKKQKKDSIKNTIDECSNIKDNFTRDDLIAIGGVAIDANKTNVQISDAIYDYAYGNLLADDVTAAAMPQCISKRDLTHLRVQIIEQLNSLE